MNDIVTESQSLSYSSKKSQKKLTDNIKYLKGVGPNIAKIFNTINKHCEKGNIKVSFF